MGHFSAAASPARPDAADGWHVDVEAHGAPTVKVKAVEWSLLSAVRSLSALLV